jgi:hypothetical protein
MRYLDTQKYLCPYHALKQIHLHLTYPLLRKIIPLPDQILSFLMALEYGKRIFGNIFST